VSPRVAIAHREVLAGIGKTPQFRRVKVRFAGFRKSPGQSVEVNLASKCLELVAPKATLGAGREMVLDASGNIRV